MNEFEKIAVISHFKRKLTEYKNNSETCRNKGLRKIYANKARWLSLLLELAEKQMPEPRLQERTNSYNEDFYCPICENKIASRIDGEWIAGRKQKYCDNCGQALDWSDVE